MASCGVIVATSDQTDGMRRYVDGQEPCVVGEPSPSAPVAIDHGAIITSVGEAAYEWRLDTDAIVWGANVGDVLPLGDLDAIATGCGFAQRVEPNSGRSRADAVSRASAVDQGRGVPYELQYALRLPDASVLWVEDIGRWFAGADGRPLRAHGVLRVINERHEREERLAYLSHFDALTGEINRWHLTELLEASIAEATKLRSSCGFLLAAIDNLGSINRAYGYDIADEVITAVAKRIHSQLRAKDHLGRYSGNKFGLILNNCTIEDMRVAAERVLATTRDEVVSTSVGPVAVTITVGGITAPRHGRTVREVLSRAQEALDAAKARRRGSFALYRPNPEREVQRKENVRATDAIISALNDRRVFLAYEPVVAVNSRQIAFFECLMRVQCTDGSMLPVNDVVPLAERLGLVRLLDHRVLELALAELIAAPELKASLNVSAPSAVDPDWWSALDAMLNAHKGLGERLTLEITETAAIHDVDEMRSFVARAKDLGCSIAIDDFGAGHTSFRNLRKLGVDMVKIDGAFVRNLTRSEDDRVFVHTLIDLARRLGLKTVAEWVQDEAAAAILAGWGCDYLQGALVGLASTERPWRKTQNLAAAS
jgi:diguanylate cyclase (GGDEF)-like protein